MWRVFVVLLPVLAGSLNEVTNYGHYFEKSGRKYCIEGRHLQIGMEGGGFPPYTQFNKQTGEWSGLCIDLLNQLAMETGFTYNITDYAKQANESWDQVFLRAIQKFDLVGSYWSTKFERSAVADFLPLFVDSQYVLVVRKPQQVVREYRLDNFLSPFTYTAWGVLIATVFVTGIMTWIYDYGFDLICNYRPLQEQNEEQNGAQQAVKSILKKKVPFWRSQTQRFKIERQLESSISASVMGFISSAGGASARTASGRLVSASFTIMVVIVLAACKLRRQCKGY